MGAVLVPINFMLKAEEVAYILRHAGATMLATDSGLAALARAAAALDTAVRDFVWLPSEHPTSPEAGMTAFDALAACDAAAPEPVLRRHGPAADRLHQRHRIQPQGRDADARRGAVAVRQLPGRCRHRVRRPGAACAAAVPLRAARCVPGPVDLLRRQQHHHRHADAGQPAAADRQAPHHQLLRAAHGVDLAAALAAVRQHRPEQPAQGLLRRVDHAGGGDARDPAAAARAAAVEPVRPDRDRAAGHDARPGGPAAQARLLRPCGAERARRAWSTTRCRTSSPARSARSCTARRT